MGVSGGSGGSGGKRHDGRKRNSVPELFKDRERKRNKFRLMSPQDKIARLGALREQYGGDMCAQVDTHMLIELIFGVDLQAEALLEERKVEIENFIDAMHGASVLAGDQGKVLSVQIQFAQPGRSSIHQECGSTKWRRILAEFGVECAVRQVCQICFFMLDSVSAAEAHILETHAQQYCIGMVSDDPNGTICQFYSAASVSVLGLSVFNVGTILEGSPRALVVTVTLHTADPAHTAEPSKARTDCVFGLTPTAVCFVVSNCMHGCDDQITFLMCEQPGTDKASFSHASEGDQEHHPSGREGPPPPPHFR